MKNKKVRSRSYARKTQTPIAATQLSNDRKTANEIRGMRFYHFYYDKNVYRIFSHSIFSCVAFSLYHPSTKMSTKKSDFLQNRFFALFILFGFVLRRVCASPCIRRKSCVLFKATREILNARKSACLAYLSDRHVAI